MRLLVTGCNGQLGWELARSLMPLGEVIAVDCPQCDFTKPETLIELLDVVKPDVIVNPAAYTAVDKAETEVKLAMQVNATAPGVLAEEAKKRGVLLVHYSTDYVFDGTKMTPYTEDDMPNPLNTYGRSKLAGDESIRQSGCDYLIFRTSWVYAARAQNFVKTILRLAQEREELKIVADQIGAPTWARNIADATAHAIHQAASERSWGDFESGVFNMTAAGSVSRYEFAEAIIGAVRRRGVEQETRIVVPITAAEHHAVAPRPNYSVLENKKLAERFGIMLPEWEKALAFCLDSLIVEEVVL
ncbi:MAG: dTDP-4-dehydrorhamnose reductase [Pseudomonadota bacterium]